VRNRGARRHAGRENHIPEKGRKSFEAYAWHITETLHEWTSKVDNKASVILSLETATLGLILVFAGAGKPLGNLAGLPVWLFRAGVVFLALAIVTAGIAIFPQLNRRDARKTWQKNYVYFGHLRRWDPANLVTAVRKTVETEADLVLSTEIVALSKIIWRKHAFIQWSMSFVASGSSLILIAWMVK
jgi:hypothetical protein